MPRRALCDRAALLEPFALLVSKYPFHGNSFEEIILAYEGGGGGGGGFLVLNV